jgi:glycopeptide antibiotics resistance protein
VVVGGLVLVVALVVVTVVDPARRRSRAGWLLGLCIAGVLAVTLFGGSSEPAVVNLVPGHTIVMELYDLHPLGVFNIFGNVAMFAPVGWLIVLVLERWRLLLATAIGVTFSAAIEVSQSFVGRVSDIDDVILNGVGALLGACVGLLLLALTRRGGEA